MATFIKAQAASLAATCFDFLTTFVLVSFFTWCGWEGSWSGVAASATGNIAGGVLNFMIGRLWVFNAAQGKIEGQFIKYALVWTGSLLLNAGGVFMITHYIGANYANVPNATAVMIAKTVTAIVVGVGYNYVLQKKFVFK